MTLGDALVLFGIAVAVLVYQLERKWADDRDVDSALDVLSAIRDALVPWGDAHFTPYDEAAGRARAQQDADAIQNHFTFSQVYEVPTEPLASLIDHPAVGGLIERDTVMSAVIALRQMNIYNQIVRQQTDFNALHLRDIVDPGLPPPRRSALAEAAFRISYMIHGSAIGEAEWWQGLKQSLRNNIGNLQAAKDRPWYVRLYSRWPLALACVFVLATLGAVAFTGYDKADAKSPRAHSGPSRDCASFQNPRGAPHEHERHC